MSPAAAGSLSPSGTTSPAVSWSGLTPGIPAGPGTSPPGGGRPGRRPDARGPTRPRPTRPARPRPAPCSCPGPAATMLPAPHATCSPSSPTCPSSHPHPGQTTRDATRARPGTALQRILLGHCEEGLQVKGHRPQRVSPAPARHELQIPVQRLVTDLARTRYETRKTRELLISGPSKRVTQETGATRITRV